MIEVYFMTSFFVVHQISVDPCWCFLSAYKYFKLHNQLQNSWLSANQSLMKFFKFQQCKRLRIEEQEERKILTFENFWGGKCTFARHFSASPLVCCVVCDDFVDIGDEKITSWTLQSIDLLKSDINWSRSLNSDTAFCPAGIFLKVDLWDFRFYQEKWCLRGTNGDSRLFQRWNCSDSFILVIFLSGTENVLPKNTVNEGCQLKWLCRLGNNLVISKFVYCAEQ